MSEARRRGSEEVALARSRTGRTGGGSEGDVLLLEGEQHAAAEFAQHAVAFFICTTAGHGDS